MVNLSNVFILLSLKCTVDLFGVGPLGQMYHKHWKFLQNCDSEIIFIKPVLFPRLRLLKKKNQAKSKALNLFQNVKQAESSLFGTLYNLELFA